MTVTKLSPEPATRSLFASVLVGVDGTEEGLEAVRQAAAVVDPAGVVAVLGVVETALAARAGFDSARVAEELEKEAERAVRAAGDLLGHGTTSRLVAGLPVPLLRAEAAATGATLLALGTHGHRRVTEILIGGVAGELLHAAPCSILLARRPQHERPFPSALVVGDDGSEQAAAALASAHELAARTGASVRVVRAAAEPVQVLVDASADADVVFVGSRGLHGVRALGSVSERVAHEARCSVLVVRPPLTS
jgi:nucleotide-binding universal stress UspA family protein